MESGGSLEAGASQSMMVARVTLTLCAAIITLAAANIEFKHHNNTELAAILQQVRFDRKYRGHLEFFCGVTMC